VGGEAGKRLAARFGEREDKRLANATQTTTPKMKLLTRMRAAAMSRAMNSLEQSTMCLLGMSTADELELLSASMLMRSSKSKLRQKDEVALGPEYRGARVSRAALEESEEDEDDEEEDDEEGSDLDGGPGEEEFDDPETADLEADFVGDDDPEIDSDNAFGDSDEEIQKRFKFAEGSNVKKPKETGGRIKKRPTAADFMSDGDEEEGEDQDDGEELSEDEESGDSEGDSEAHLNGASLLNMEAEESGDDEDDESAEDDEDDDMSSFINDEDEEEEDSEEEEDDEDEEGGDLHAKLKRTMSKDKAKDEDDGDLHARLKTTMNGTQMGTVSQQAKADAAKGAAIRGQRRAFDSILNLRIRLQKALVATNTFSVVEDSQDAGMEPYQAAEEAAVKLWNTIDSVRYSLLPGGRAKAGVKRKREIQIDTPSQDIWDSMDAIEELAISHRRNVLDKWSNKVRNATAAVSTRQLVDNANQTLLAALDDQMITTDRLVKKVRMPRSCAPVQAAKKVEEDKDIYDDADFYQLLLKELVDQRSIDTGAPGESVPTVRWAALKEAKTRKQVDRKASKGRKLRFTVHEKLQNFMAPEDRRTWEEHAIDRFFGTLFGQKMELKEDDVSDEEMGGVTVEQAGLRLFQS
jgi:protein AATF/BFR2